MKSALFCGDLHAAVLFKVAAARPCSEARPHADYSIIFNPLNPSPAPTKHADGAPEEGADLRLSCLFVLMELSAGLKAATDH